MFFIVFQVVDELNSDLLEGSQLFFIRAIDVDRIQFPVFIPEFILDIGKAAVIGPEIADDISLGRLCDLGDFLFTDLLDMDVQPGFPGF